jgi:hypothetical protein
MKITAITISVDYDDFLVHSLKHNKGLFDRWIIVTNKNSKNTVNMCKEYEVECIETDAFYEGAIFNKYAGINKALEKVDDGWVLFIDADIILHETFRRVLEELRLNESFLYGIDRLYCEGPSNWKQYLEGSGILKEYWLLHTSNLKMSARLVHLYGSEGEDGRFCGWNPVGFFQLAHRSAFDWYPQDSLSADHCDLIFARHWPRSKRILIPEMYCIHLESDYANKGVNWYGRKSQPFIMEEDFYIQKEKSYKILEFFIIILLWLQSFFIKKKKVY